MGSSSRANYGDWVTKAFGKEIVKKCAIAFPKSWKVRQWLGYDEMNADLRMFASFKVGRKRESFMQDWIVLSCDEIDLEQVVELARNCGVEDKVIKRRIKKHGGFTEEEIEGLFEEEG